MASVWDNLGSDTVDPNKSLIQQQRMAKATNPWNAQATNELGISNNMRDRPGKLQSLQEAPTKSTPAAPTQEWQKPVQQQTATVVDPNIQRIQQNLGSMAYRLQEKVNNFIKQGTQNIAATATSQNVWDPTTQSFKVGEVTTDIAGGIDPVVQQKVKEQQALQSEMSQYFEKDPITGEYKPKSFYEVLGQEAEGDAKINNLLNIAEQLNALENMNLGGSEEARELQRRLHEMDTDGLVTGLYRAKQAYEETFGGGGKEGLSWYGDSSGGGTGQLGSYSISDILSLSEDDIRKEVENATTLSSGLFGGSFEAGLKQAVDTESEAYKEARRQDAEASTQLANTARDYFTSVKTRLGAEGEKFKQAFKQSATDIINELEQDPSGAGREAVAFIKQIMDTEDPIKTIMNMMLDPNSGLNTEQRKKIGDYLGESMFGTGGGKLANWLSELSTTGTLTDDEGEEINITSQQKAELNNILASGDPQKAIDYVKNEIIAKGLKTDLEKVVNDVSVNPDSFKSNMETITKNMVKSFMTISGSQTEDAVRRSLNIDDATWRGLTPEQRSKLFIDTINKDPRAGSEIINTATSATKSQMEDFNADKSKVQKKLDDKKKEIATVKPKLEATLNGFSAKLEDYQNNIANYISTNFSKVNTDAKRIEKGVGEYLVGKYGKVISNKIPDMSKTVAFVRRMANEIASKNEYSGELKTALYDFKSTLPPAVFNAMVNGASITPTALIESLVSYSSRSPTWGKAIDDFIANEPKMLALQTPSYDKYSNSIKEASANIKSQIEEVNAMEKNITDSQNILNKISSNIKSTIFHPKTIIQNILSGGGSIDMGEYNPYVIDDLLDKVNSELSKIVSGYFVEPTVNTFTKREVKDVGDYGIPKYAPPAAVKPTTNTQPYITRGNTYSSQPSYKETPVFRGPDGTLYSYTADRGYTKLGAGLAQDIKNSGKYIQNLPTAPVTTYTSVQPTTELAYPMAAPNDTEEEGNTNNSTKRNIVESNLPPK